MDKAEVQAAAEAEEKEEHIISLSSNIRNNPAERHRQNQRLKRDRKEAVSTFREKTTSESVLISPQIRRYSCLSKLRRGRTMAMMAMTNIMTLMKSITMVFVG